MAERVKVLVWRRPEGRDLPLPRYATPGASGMDLRACLEDSLTLEPGQRAVVPTGLHVAIPEGYEGQIRPRSGWAAQEGVTLLNAPGTIDSDYRGEIRVVLINLGSKPVTLRRGDRIAQLVIVPVVQAEWEEVEELPPTARGEGGFGHTGQA